MLASKVPLFAGVDLISQMIAPFFFSDEELASNGSKLYCLLNPFVTVVEIYTNTIKLSFMNMSQYYGDLNKESLSHNNGYF